LRTCDALWQLGAQNHPGFGIEDREIDRMASAFEHDDS
jgi:hypothetical protein